MERVRACWFPPLRHLLLYHHLLYNQKTIQTSPNRQLQTLKNLSDLLDRLQPLDGAHPLAL